jgi:hypothetical protein
MDRSTGPVAKSWANRDLQRTTSEDIRMKIQIIRGTVANGGPVRVGQVISVDPKEAQQLVNMGKAVVYENRAKGLDEAEAPPVTTRTTKTARKPKAK